MIGKYAFRKPTAIYNLHSKRKQLVKYKGGGNFQLNYNYEYFQSRNKALIGKAEIRRGNYFSWKFTPQFTMYVCVLHKREVGTLESIKDISPDNKFSEQWRFPCPKGTESRKRGQRQKIEDEEKWKGTKERGEYGKGKGLAIIVLEGQRNSSGQRGDRGVPQAKEIYKEKRGKSLLR